MRACVRAVWSRGPAKNGDDVNRPRSFPRLCLHLAESRAAPARRWIDSHAVRLCRAVFTMTAISARAGHRRSGDPFSAQLSIGEKPPDRGPVNETASPRWTRCLFPLVSASDAAQVLTSACLLSVRYDLMKTFCVVRKPSQ